MAKSIKRQLVVVFVGLIAMLLAVVFIVNSMFLRQYYVLHKKCPREAWRKKSSRRRLSRKA